MSDFRRSIHDSSDATFICVGGVSCVFLAERKRRDAFDDVVAKAIPRPLKCVLGQYGQTAGATGEES